MTPADEFDVRMTTARTGATVLHVKGDLDLATAPALGSVIGEVGMPTHLVIDLTECGFLDSSGMRVLAVAHRDAPGARMDLVTTDAGILRALEIARLDTMFRIHASLDEALES